MKYLNVLYMLLLLWPIRCLSQEIEGNFVIICFECKQKGIEVADHFKKNSYDYYWIASIDSIVKDAKSFSPERIKFFPLIMDMEIYYSPNFFKTDTPYQLLDDSITIVNNKRSIYLLSKIFNKNKKLIQRIKTSTTKPTLRGIEDILVYACPVHGIFNSTMFTYIFMGSVNPEFQTIMYQPIQNFSEIDDFWKRSEGKIIEVINYSTLNFNKFTPSIIQDRSRFEAYSD